ncbi:hypothetical protein [Hyphomicrobium sp.]|uniref:hypothetical protein n=1 Tax=Hyphomicrobium sp. TaxID=82 RepID=UPI000FA0896B|nr:hypothetical protein [Hyphomicrobium sp.]RUP08233.1 MAG: hypothetical protein EKK38_15200 [Hyphomicrobium sp.]
MIKGELYRHYCCSQKLKVKEAATAGRALHMPMKRLKLIVIDKVSARISHSDRLEDRLKPT